MDVNEFAKSVYRNAMKKGFHDGQDTIASHVANLHSEVSEFWEAYREDRLMDDCGHAAEMKELGIPVLTAAEEELADIVIRALDSMLWLDIDPEHALRAKHAFNRNRKRLHGGKIV